VTLRVAIIGAGIGGLALAQGLHRGGLDVAVYERDDGLAARPQGYRLHLDRRGGEALEQCLPPGLVALVRATSGQPSRAVTVLDRRLRERHRELTSIVDNWSGSVDRATLREALSRGLDVHYGHECVGYSAEPDGVVAHFAGVGPVRADVLVGADGVGSAVRRQYLPHAGLVDTGQHIIYGRTRLDPQTRPLLPAAMHDGFTAIVDGRVGVATGLVEFRSPPDVYGLTPADDYLMWAVTPPGEVSAEGPVALHAAALRMLRRWHPDLQQLVGRAEVEQTFLIRVRVAEPVRPWTPSRVTVLGDAIHAMSPARGSGANIALQDAAALSRELAAGRSTVEDCIGMYEARMRGYGFAAVAASRAAETTMARRRYPWLRWLARRPDRRGAGSEPVPAE
jgi:2-polyprenyl-6-methoxyphenol hydroxylase-like FAD-dependent oxidoreductase